MLDPNVPASLFSIQSWFGAIIRQKMTDDRSIWPQAPNGRCIQEESKRYIVETDTLSAWQRMELYTQSYWLRLLDNLQEEFPMLVRLFGEHDFDAMLGIPYLDAHPPMHWSLNVLGARFVPWIASCYQEEDKKLVKICAEIDWACQELFVAARGKKAQVSEALLSKKLTLQPTVRLFELPGNFLEFRKALLAHPAAYWQEHAFPELVKDRPYYFAIFRKNSLTIDWKELSKEEYMLLTFLDQGMNIDEACEAMQQSDLNVQLLEAEIAFWAQEWLIFDWVSTKT